MFKKSLLALGLLTLPLTASANWSAGAGYANLSDEDLSFGVVYGAMAYEFAQEGSQFSFMPEFRIGTGITDEEALGVGGGVKVEVNRFTSLSLRAQYNHENGFYAYVMPSYANLDVEVSSFYGTASDDSSELGFGVGMGKKLNDNFGIEISYERYDEVDVLTLGFKYAF
jgi:hypothetical protein